MTQHGAKEVAPAACVRGRWQNGTMLTAKACPLCGYEVEAVPLDEIADFVRVVFPLNAGEVVPNAREFLVGRVALLHHGCLSPQASTDSRWWNPDTSWWACRDPERQLDSDANFDLNCAACAERWAIENRN